jgi:hypothetical protein
MLHLEKSDVRFLFAIIRFIFSHLMLCFTRFRLIS